MKKNSVPFLKMMNLLTSEQRRNLALLLIVPILLFFTRDYIRDEAQTMANNLDASVRVDDVTRRINEKDPTYSMLQDAEPYYKYNDILVGMNINSYRQYFSPKPPPVVTSSSAPVVGPGAGQPAEPVITFENGVSLIYLGENNSYAIIDGKLLREGETTLSGLTVNTIESNRVLLKGKRSSQWVTLKF